MPELPTVSEAFEANIAPFVAAMHDMQDELLKTAGLVKTVQEYLDSLHGKTVDINVEAAGTGAAAAATALAGLAGAERGVTADSGAMSDALAAAGGAAAGAGLRFGAFGFGLRLTGNALHWIVAGSAELLAVGIPALVALGSGLFVASQGAQNAYNHMTALYDTLEAVGPATHQTMGDVLGLGHAFQTAQNAANPGVYEILGSAVNDAKTHFTDLAGAGLQVVHMFDEFSARITTDLQGSLGRELGGLLSGMVTDLQQFGNVLGNLGHALLNFAADMPGLAHVLLGVAVGLSEVIEWASRGGVFITMAMGLEEMYRWGGLLLGVMARLAGAGGLFATFAAGGGFITRFGAAIKALVVQAGFGAVALGGMISRLPVFTEEAAAAGAAVDALGMDVAVAGEAMSTNWIAAIAAGAAVLGFLAYKLVTAKDATEQWIASTNQAVQSASDLNVLNTIGKTLAENSIRLAGAQERLAQSAQHVTETQGVLSRYVQGGSGAMARQAQDVQDLTQQQTHLVGVAANVITNANALGRAFHTSAVGAMALANAAGVNLQSPLAKSSEAMKIAEQQIRNLITGLGAMGAPAGMVGADMSALGIQSQLAATKVQQLNSAWDAWIASVTGGATAMSQVETALTGMGKAALQTSAGVTGSLGSISQAAKGSSYTLEGFGQKAMQSWQQFTGAIQTGNSAIDQLRTGMAEGVVSVGRFQSTVKGLVGQMAPFTEGNRTAVEMLSQLAHEAGGPVTTSLKTLENWAGVAGNTARDQFAKGMLDASSAMGNMSKVAQNLSAVINSQLDAAMAAAIAKTLNISGLTQVYTNDLAKYGATAPQTAAAQNNLNKALQQAYSLGQQASAGLNATGSSAARAGGQMATAAGQAYDLFHAENSLYSKSISITTYFRQLYSVQGSPLSANALLNPGHAAGTDNAPPGWAWVGERGPELMAFAGGERILSSADSQRFMTSPGGFSGGGGGGTAGAGAGGTLHATVPVHVFLDGQQVFESVKTQTARYNVRNGNPQSGRLSPS